MVSALSRALPCVTCGYDLRNLSDDGACPECATAISRSLRGDRLAAADPHWLRRITRGQRLIAAGLLTAVSGVVAAIGLLITFRITASTLPRLPILVEHVFTVLTVGALLVVPVALLVAAVGVFLLTAQEGRDRERESPWSARNVTRWSAIGAVVACIGVLALRAAPLPGTAAPAADTALRLLMVALLTIAGVAVLKRLAGIVRRVPDKPLAERIDRMQRFIRWGVPAAGVYLLVLVPLAPVLGGGGRVGVAMLLMPFACVGFIAIIGLLLAAARLVDIMRRCAACFRACLAMAEHA